MTDEFFLSYSQLNLVFFTPEKKTKVVDQNKLQEMEEVEIFEYRKK